MKTEEDEAFDELARKQGDWGGGYQAKRQMAADKLQDPAQEPCMNEELSCVYKATTKKGEVAHFGEYSSAKAWAGFGKVEQVPLKTLVVIEKSAKPCGTCEALARTVMLDQTSHDAQRSWVGLTTEETSGFTQHEMTVVKYVSKVLQEKNT